MLPYKVCSLGDQPWRKKDIVYDFTREVSLGNAESQAVTHSTHISITDLCSLWPPSTYEIPSRFPSTSPSSMQPRELQRALNTIQHSSLTHFRASVSLPLALASHKSSGKKQSRELSIQDGSLIQALALTPSKQPKRKNCCLGSCAF